MKDKYYMRDLMEMFRVGRNTIKYYEEQGIIKGIREPNGYRSYSYLDMKRIERVFVLRRLGFSIEQIKIFLTGISVQNELELNQERICMLERQIAALTEELHFLKYMDSFQRKIFEYYKQYEICHDFEVCLGCGYNQEIKDKWLMQSDIKIIHFNSDFTIAREEVYEKAVIQQTMKLNKTCLECTSNRKIRSLTVHGIIKQGQMDNFPALLQKISHDMEERGYEMEHKVYCLYSYYIEEQPREEGVAIGYYIPIKKK